MVKRYGKPSEVAYLVKFLISDEANFINNSIIRIDGGQIGSIKKTQLLIQQLSLFYLFFICVKASKIESLPYSIDKPPCIYKV